MNKDLLKKLVAGKEKDNKFFNQKTNCLSRHPHDSKFEADYCNRLLAMQERGEIAGYEIQKSFELCVNNVLVCRHIVDFVLWPSKDSRDGLTVHEVKGFRTRDWILKRRLFQAIYPEIKYITISKGSSCKKHRQRMAGKTIKKFLSTKLRRSV